MSAYECMIAYHPETGEVGVQEQLERARQFITDQGGEVSATHDWGTRDLAYPIQKQKRGLFYVIEFQGDGRAVSELERNLRIADPVLRYITVKVDPNRALGFRGRRTGCRRYRRGGRICRSTGRGTRELINRRR
jgi:small subunit ribosomal protein S6